MEVPSPVILQLTLKYEGDDQGVDDQGLDERKADDQCGHDLAGSSRISGYPFHGSPDGVTLSDGAAQGSDADSKTCGKGDTKAPSGHWIRPLQWPRRRPVP